RLAEHDVQVDAPALEVGEGRLPLTQAGDAEVQLVVRGAPARVDRPDVGPGVLRVAPDVQGHEVDRVDVPGGEVVDRPAEPLAAVRPGGVVHRVPRLPVAGVGGVGVPGDGGVAPVEADVAQEVLGAVGAPLEPAGAVTELEVGPADVLQA